MLKALDQVLFPDRTGQLALDQFKRDYSSESFYFLPKEFKKDAKARRAKEKAGQGAVFREVIFGKPKDFRYAKYRVDLSASTAVRVKEGSFHDKG